MSLPKVILVPTDFGEPSDAALACAVDYARAFGAQIVLMHAYEVPVIGFPEGAMVATAELSQGLLEAAKVGLERQMRTFSASGVSIRSVVKLGAPAPAVLETAAEVGAGLVCIGTHGRRGLPRMLLGSVAEKVVRTAPVPVLTVHASEHGEGAPAG